MKSFWGETVPEETADDTSSGVTRTSEGEAMEERKSSTESAGDDGLEVEVNEEDEEVLSEPTSKFMTRIVTTCINAEL